MTNVFQGMKLYLDDERKAPFGWELVKTAQECLAILRTGKVMSLSLDHDLAEEHYENDWEARDKHGPLTGYDVACWLEERAHNGNWEVVPQEIGCHSMNPGGKTRIVACIESILRLAESAGRTVKRVPALYHASEDEFAWQRADEPADNDWPRTYECPECKSALVANKPLSIFDEATLVCSVCHYHKLERVG